MITKKKKIFYFIIKGISLFFIFFLIFFFGKSNLKLYQKRIKIEKAEQIKIKRLENLEKERKELEFRFSEREREGVLEQIAREQLNMKKEGEKVVAFPIIERPQEFIEQEKKKKKEFFEKFLEKIHFLKKKGENRNSN